MAPSASDNDDGGGRKNGLIIPAGVSLNGINDFVEVRQIEEWDLKPVEVGNTNDFEGKVTIRREPVNESDKCDSFEIEYDCRLRLSSKTQDYY